jgi:hypothetical protein
MQTRLKPPIFRSDSGGPRASRLYCSASAGLESSTGRRMAQVKGCIEDAGATSSDHDALLMHAAYAPSEKDQREASSNVFKQAATNGSFQR